MRSLSSRVIRCSFVVATIAIVGCGDGSQLPPSDLRGAAGSSGSAGTSGSSGMADCSGGPLDAPVARCAPTTPASTGDERQDCVNRINQLRWECQCLPPLERWTDAEACADQQSEYDSTRGPHAGFSDEICSPDGRGQNECPDWNSVSHAIDGCLQAMWDEGPGPFAEHGHYLNMTDTRHSRVACGFYATPGGDVWSVQNFE